MVSVPASCSLANYGLFCYELATTIATAATTTAATATTTAASFIDPVRPAATSVAASSASANAAAAATHKVPVVCNAVPGTFVTSSVTFVCSCAACGGQPEWEPRDWLEHCGRSRTGQWYKETAVLVAGAARPQRLATYLRRWGYKAVSVPVAPGVREWRLLRESELPQPTQTAQVDLALKDDGQELRLTDVLPAEVSVLCNNVPGTLLADTWRIRCRCAACAAAGPADNNWSLTLWERHCEEGKPTKHLKPLVSIRLPPGSVPELPPGT
ncbi:hypothetical protein GPECTOR_10g873 [Gonium pectorale]|uniref:Uncharacterized protein n=1 Tax=Gonium pectorale TaxID=33097 RepID=A0A150GR69_GONPE|nr:hypothetical protein GPECTOR_10g873 [Gonium pectorale]|eukprot:KXZ52242.1 hypothetical protein GPECTOR_10g873 [Gonium pectorale]